MADAYSPGAHGDLRIDRGEVGVEDLDLPLGDDVDLDALVSRTRGYTGADLEDLVRRAGLLALRDSMEAAQVTAAHFDAALEESRASVTPEMEREYEDMRRTLKQEKPQRIPIGFAPPGHTQREAAE